MNQHVRPNNIPASGEQEVENQINDILRKGVNRSSKSPWSFLLVIVKKKNNQIRICTDNCSLNAIKVKNKFPLPKIDEILSRLNGNKCFSFLDTR